MFVITFFDFGSASCCGPASSSTATASNSGGRVAPIFRIALKPVPGRWVPWSKGNTTL